MNSDPLLSRFEFMRLQEECKTRFTHDAYVRGEPVSNSRCLSCSFGDRSFQQFDACGHTVWLQLPHANPTLSLALISHYFDCKDKSPHDTGACFVVPAVNARYSSMFAARGMRLVHTYPRGSYIYSKPDTTQSMPCTRSAMQVWFDAPVPQPTASRCNHDTDLTMIFDATAVGIDGFIRILADTGASRDFCSLDFVHEHCLPLRPSKIKTAKLADASKETSIAGQTTITLQLGDFTTTVTPLVLAAPTGIYDLILGESFLTRHKANLNYRMRALTLIKRGQLYVIPSRALTYTPTQIQPNA
ncbi:MAG: retroviral-like aspartic protease, partial [Spirochaetia bacterium]|nr:retroviral-like aspartic protease [Spirochaetia bacterium]